MLCGKDRVRTQIPSPALCHCARSLVQLTHHHPRVWPLLSGRAIRQVFGGGLRWLLLAKKEGLLLFLGSGSFGIDYRKIRSNTFDGLYVKFHIARRQSLRRWRRWRRWRRLSSCFGCLAATTLPLLLLPINLARLLLSHTQFSPLPLSRSCSTRRRTGKGGGVFCFFIIFGSAATAAAAGAFA
jgi:hypothetical protein